MKFYPAATSALENECGRRSQSFTLFQTPHIRPEATGFRYRIINADFFLHAGNLSEIMKRTNPSCCAHRDMPMESPMVTPRMVRSRTVELALNAGRSSIEIRQSDYERAKRELTGETDSERQQAVLYGG